MRILLMLAAVFSLSIDAMAANNCNRGTDEVLSVKEWSIEPIDNRTNLLTVTYSSTLPKPVRMIDASAGFIDALGGEIGRFTLERDVTLSVGREHTETGRWGLFTFERLLTLRHEEVQTFVCTRSVLYSDGTKEEF